MSVAVPEEAASAPGAPAGREALLEVRDLHVGYRTYKGWSKVLNGVGLEVRPGEKVGLVGESGCGKTTTMKAILGTLAANGRIEKGSIRFAGRDLLGAGRRELRRIRGRRLTAIYQNPGAALNPVFTVGQQLDAVIAAHNRGLSAAERRRRAVAALEAARLPDAARLLDNYPVQLSGGMKQRVCIALALASEPELVIADEPGTALDVTIEDQVMREFMRLVEERNLATVFITHSLGVVRKWMDRVYVMYAGTIVEAAPTEELFARPLHPYTQALFRAVPRLTGGGIPEGIPGRVPEYVSPPEGCRFRDRCPARMEVCRSKPALVDQGGGHLVACWLYR